MAILRKIKEGLKKIIQNKKSLSRTAGSALKKKAPEEAKKETLGVRETAVGQTKFSHPEPSRQPWRMPQEVPWGYGEDKVVLQVRDPWWLHAYWEITGGTLDNLKARLGDAFYSSKMVIRVYDVSDIIFNGSNAHSFFDIEINPEANNWYIDAGGPGRSWCVDVGLRLANGDFITIVRSNTVRTPLEGSSWITDEEWMIPEDMFARLYGMGFGFGRSSPVGKGWQEKMKREFFSSGAVASVGMSSSPVKKPVKERQFWMVVNTELIVYGATEPDAKVTVQGKDIRLRPDGTFTLRFALPDGRQVIPVQATSADAAETRTITPVVTKETK
ncbi:MAG: DUF4912 domain-containing protein [Candidatus Omnitrophica bacterium]|nr:DUF4912 domain-containing protein [Candidatus Omnitrophota bacterium]